MSIKNRMLSRVLPAQKWQHLEQERPRVRWFWTTGWDMANRQAKPLTLLLLAYLCRARQCSTELSWNRRTEFGICVEKAGQYSGRWWPPVVLEMTHVQKMACSSYPPLPNLERNRSPSSYIVINGGLWHTDNILRVRSIENQGKQHGSN